ncbi:MAG TPA: NAD(P)-dependent oxidoreductase [Acidimicrobiales bacterium]|nr:NAD(P)-dependent oxidoreductase [Acidimicrobiales bacterium]
MTLRAAVVGLGAVGTRAARQLAAAGAAVTLVHPSAPRLAFVRHEVGAPTDAVVGGIDDLPDGLDVVVLCHPGDHRGAAERAVEREVAVVSVADDPAVVRRLLDVHDEAAARGVTVVVGAAMAPGLGCLLARWAADRLAAVTEVHVASVGTGGPACARRHHRALTEPALDHIDGAWVQRPGSSGRELVWFPEPLGGADCYRGGLADPLVLVPAFPGVRRVTARVAATRRDRLTSWLPMLRPPHPEGLVGGVRVEVRGFRPPARPGGPPVADAVVVGASAPPAIAAGAVAATAAIAAGSHRLPAGAAGLAVLADDPGPWLADLGRRGVPAWLFEGADARRLGT